MSSKPAPGPRFCRAALLASAVLLSACAVHLVSDYDPQMDAELTQVNADLTTFVEQMVDEAGTPAGTYAANKNFYFVENGKLATIRARAEAHRALGSCPTTAVIAQAVQANVSQQPSASVLGGQSASEILAQIPKDDCGVILIALIQGGFSNLQKLHEAQGQRGIPASARDPILVGGTGSLLRSAMQVEIAQKAAFSTGAN